MTETREMLLQQMELLLDKAKERKDDSDDLTKLSFGMSNIARAIANCEEKEELLNTLKSIDGTLKHIEQSLRTKKERFVPEFCDSEGNIRKDYGKPTINPEN